MTPPEDMSFAHGNIPPPIHQHVPPTLTPSITVANISTQPDNASKIKVAEPDIFDGSIANFRDWVRQVAIYMRAKQVASDKSKILTTLSYMKKGNAAIWAQQYVDQYLDQPMMGTWDQFTLKLHTRFQDCTHNKKVHEQLERFLQGRFLVDEYMNRLETMLSDAGLNRVETEKV